MTSRKHGQHLARGPGGVKEKTNAVAYAEFTQFMAKRNQVIVMNPYYIIVIKERSESLRNTFSCLKIFHFA